MDELLLGIIIVFFMLMALLVLTGTAYLIAWTVKEITFRWKYGRQK